MIERRLLSSVIQRLAHVPAVVILGPRQVGKTTLARAAAADRPSIYLDLETAADRALLTNPTEFLEEHFDKLVILDEVQRMLELFQPLRGLIDEARRQGKGTGRYLILGSASNELLRQSSESLAGRVSYLELAPVTCIEFEPLQPLWVRGGFPPSLLAAEDPTSMLWRKDFIRTYLERDIPQLGPRIPAETLRRFWTMLAHQQAALWNGARLSAGLGVSSPTVGRYLDLLVDLMLVRRLQPWFGNTRKRLVKSPKVFVRDSGLVHALLDIGDIASLLAHPVVGASWEGWVIEQLIAAMPDATPTFYRSATGDEIDLILEHGGRRIAVEISRSMAPTLDRSFYAACEQVKVDEAWLVYPGQRRYPMGGAVTAIGVRELAQRLGAPRDVLNV